MREFLQYCGCNVDNYTKEDRKRKMATLEKIASEIKIKSKVLEVIKEMFLATIIISGWSFHTNLKTGRICIKDKVEMMK